MGKYGKHEKFQGNHLQLKNIHGKSMEQYYDIKKYMGKMEKMEIFKETIYHL